MRTTYPDRVVAEDSLYRVIEHRYEENGITYKTIEKQRVHYGKILFTKVNVWNSRDGYIQIEF